MRSTVQGTFCKADILYGDDGDTSWVRFTPEFTVSDRFYHAVVRCIDGTESISVKHDLTMSNVTVVMVQNQKGDALPEQDYCRLVEAVVMEMVQTLDDAVDGSKTKWYG